MYERVCVCVPETEREEDEVDGQMQELLIVYESFEKGCREHLSVSFTLKARKDGKDGWEDK